MKDKKMIIIKAFKNLKYWLDLIGALYNLHQRRRERTLKHNLLMYYIVKANKY